MNKITVFIDESGTLPDPKDPVVIVAAVGVEKVYEIVRISKTVRKVSKKENIPEVKFYRAGEKTKLKFLKELTKSDADIFVLIVEKQGKGINDTTENFAVLCWQLVEEVIIFYQDSIKEIVFDRHFHRQADQEAFNKTLLQLCDKHLSLVHVDSQKEPAVNAADMSAGSVLWANTGKTAKFYQIIKPKIVVEKKIQWKKIREKFWQEKTRSNRRERPSKASN